MNNTQLLETGAVLVLPRSLNAAKTAALNNRGNIYPGTVTQWLQTAVKKYTMFGKKNTGG